MKKLLIAALVSTILLVSCSKRTGPRKPYVDTRLRDAKALVAKYPKLQPMYNEFTRYSEYISAEEYMELVKYSMISESTVIVK